MPGYFIFKAHFQSNQAAIPVFQGAISSFQGAITGFQGAIPGFQVAIPVFQCALPGFQIAISCFQDAIPFFQSPIPVFTDAIPGFQSRIPVFKVQFRVFKLQFRVFKVQFRVFKVPFRFFKKKRGKFEPDKGGVPILILLANSTLRLLHNNIITFMKRSSCNFQLALQSYHRYECAPMRLYAFLKSTSEGLTSASVGRVLPLRIATLFHHQVATRPQVDFNQNQGELHLKTVEKQFQNLKN